MHIKIVFYFGTYINRRCLYITKNVRLSWNGLWVLIMLLYSDVVHTSVSILNCPMLTGYDGKKSMVIHCMCMVTTVKFLKYLYCLCVWIQYAFIWVHLSTLDNTDLQGIGNVHTNHWSILVWVTCFITWCVLLSHRTLLQYIVSWLAEKYLRPLVH